ncbi:MAG: hypothetical protein HC905_28125 [Bacteroidales bacterium]|nr:hypothetical protein [Bacteroidales bacterium]
MKKFYYLSLILTGFSFFVLSGQDVKPIKSDSLNYLSFENAVVQLEQKYQVKFYFDVERLQNRRIHNSIINLSMDEALERLERHQVFLHSK